MLGHSCGMLGNFSEIFFVNYHNLHYSTTLKIEMRAREDDVCSIILSVQTVSVSISLCERWNTKDNKHIYIGFGGLWREIEIRTCHEREQFSTSSIFFFSIYTVSNSTFFNVNPRPDALMKEQLVDMTGLSPRVIRVWFQNKRCKHNKKANAMKLQIEKEKVSSLARLHRNGRIIIFSMWIITLLLRVRNWKKSSMVEWMVRSWSRRAQWRMWMTTMNFTHQRVTSPTKSPGIIRYQSFFKLFSRPPFDLSPPPPVFFVLIIYMILMSIFTQFFIYIKVEKLLL